MKKCYGSSCLKLWLREVGLKVGTPSRKGFVARVRALAADDPVLAGLAEPLLSIIEVMTREIERPTRRVIDAKVEPTCRRLMSKRRLMAAVLAV